MMTGRLLIARIGLLILVLIGGASFRPGSGIGAEKLIGLQSAPSIAMAPPWFAEEARLYPKYDLDFQLVYIASSGIVTAAMSSGSGGIAIVGGEGPIRAFLGGNTGFVFIGSVKNVLTHSIMGKPDIKKPEDLKGKESASAVSAATLITSLNTAFDRRVWISLAMPTSFKPAARPKLSKH